MFGVGHLADRMHLRKFLTFGMLASAAAVCAFGMAAFLEIHRLWYFVVIQIVGGARSSSPAASVIPARYADSPFECNSPA